MFEGLNFVDQLLNRAIELAGPEGEVEYIRVLPTTDHALLELSAVLCHNLLHAHLLQFCSSSEVCNDNLVTAKVANCALEKVVLPAHLNHIVNESTLGFLDFGLDAFGEGAVGHVRQNQEVFGDVFLL